ncbi:MAG: NADH-quinone oxidoreductase subunit L [Syntrophorhabdales bacterium]|jgi:NADH-quinone oxidoreductase subunit L
MLRLLWLIPAIPCASFLLLALFGRRLPRGAVAAIGTGSIGLSMVVSFLVAEAFINGGHGGLPFAQPLWTWLAVDGFAPVFGFYLDGLSLVMMLVVSLVAFLIHLYSIGFMAGDEGYSRFFAYMNLFVGSMLILVLSDNLLALYLGWEGVGLSSYLLIGFWYREPENGKAAMKAFVVTRVGDTAFTIGLFMLFTGLGTLQIQEIAQKAPAMWAPGSLFATIAAALLLGGAVGKSAQIPLQTWLPDAMAGPTPVSALIHAATMVTAGVYLIARMNALFMLAPQVRLILALVGTVTLLTAGASALTQKDIKRVLAYSTMSQVGYMFLALGVGAWSAAIFHFVTHACFKALLFLSAGVVIQALDNEHDIFRMGGLRKALPWAFWTFLIGAASLSALPFVTAGFYSKDLILLGAWASPQGGHLLWAAGLAGSALTSLYAFRVVFVAFFGRQKARVSHRPGLSMKIPVALLSVLSIGAGLLEVPKILGNWTLIADLTHGALPAAGSAITGATTEGMLLAAGAVVPLLGLLAAGLLYLSGGASAAMERIPGMSAVRRFWYSGWGFDRLYNAVFVTPFTWAARIDRRDGIDSFYEGTARIVSSARTLLVVTQSGKVRWYVMGVAIGALVFILIAVLG